jgi:hypothetical protein
MFSEKFASENPFADGARTFFISVTALVVVLFVICGGIFFEILVLSLIVSPLVPIKLGRVVENYCQHIDIGCTDLDWVLEFQIYTHCSFRHVRDVISVTK